MIRYLRPPSPVAQATRRQILIGRIRETAHRLLNRLGVPGAVAPLAYRDAVTGCTLTVDVGVFFTRISVDGRDYYFDRVTGRFDGTGQAV
jgi:hypothetical protein